MVIGGEVGEYGDASFISDSATLISPDPIQAPVPECIRNLAEFPLQIYGGAGAVIGTRIKNSKAASLPGLTPALQEESPTCAEDGLRTASS